MPSYQGMATKPRLARTLLSRKPAAGAEWVSLTSLLFLAAIFALCQWGGLDLDSRMSADFTRVFTHHEFWRAFTSPLLHADLEHLGSNALYFAGLAYLLNGYFGAWVFPVLSFLAGGLINLLILPAYPPDVTIVGASGIVYFMAAFWLVLYFSIERGLPGPRRLVNAAAFALALFVPETFHAQVSSLSHAVGFGLGILCGAGYFIAHREAIRAHEEWREEEPEDDLDPGSGFRPDALILLIPPDSDEGPTEPASEPYFERTLSTNPPSAYAKRNRTVTSSSP